MMKKTKNFLAVMLIFGLALSVAPQKAYAQVCPVYGTPCEMDSLITLSFEVLENAVTAVMEIADESFDSLKKKVNKKIKKVESAIINASNGLSQTVTSGAVTISKAHQKNLDTYHSKMVTLEKRKHEAEVAKHNQPTAKDCLRATKLQYKAGGDVIAEGVAEAIYKNSLAKMNNTDGKGTIRKTANAYQQHMANFCDPSMPNAPDNCVAGDLTNSEKNPSLLIGEMTVEANAMPAIAKIIELVGPKGLDVMALPAYKTAAGQRAFMQGESYKVRSAFPLRELATLAADRVGVMNTRDQATAMRERNLGVGANTSQVMGLYNSRPSKVSRAEQRELDRQSSSSVQDFLDTMGLSEGQMDRIKIYNMISVLENEYEGLMEDRKSNIFRALRYANSIN